MQVDEELLNCFMKCLISTLSVGCNGPRGPTECLRSIPQAGPSKVGVVEAKNGVIEDCLLEAGVA